MDPLISAIVPFYNVEEFFDPCLSSIARQTYERFEVLMVDDGSPDNSRAIAQRWAERDSRFKIITQENRGLGAARNTGTANAAGDYLMYIDSDDLVAARAFEQLLRSLEQSGSDFAAAHIWRLPLTRPIEPSSAHAEPFGERRQRTSIREIPLLMRDRMAWNKLWRRSFWEAGEFFWPEMKFEDFPVTIRAHLEAAAVDTLPDPIYVWRERPVGQSISGQGKELGNVRDRVEAARMVLDTVDALATREVRELVHSHLVDVDLREVMGSMVVGADADQPEIDRLIRCLVTRIDQSLVRLARPELRLAYRAALENDMATVRAIARKRAGLGNLPRTKGELARRAPHALAERAGSYAAKVSPVRPRAAKLVDRRTAADRLVFRILLPVDKRLAERGKVTGELGALEAQVHQAVVADGLLCDLAFDTLDVATTHGFQQLTVRLTAGPVRLEGHVTATPDLLAGVRRAGYWVQGTVRHGRFGVERKRRVVLADDARVEAGNLVLRLSVPTGTLVVEQPWPSTGVECQVVDHHAVIPLAVLIGNDPPDNPHTLIASRRLCLRTITGDEPIRLSGDGIRVQVADRDVELLRSDDASAFLTHRPLPAS